MLSLSIRQTRRIVRRVREEGPQGVVHRFEGEGIEPEAAPGAEGPGARALLREV
jgi:hypothetical protein